jgi:SOS-response transcriptional repressor LexA
MAPNDYGLGKPVAQPHRTTWLTDAELAVLAALDDLIEELGYSPTHRQMLTRLGWTSKGTLHRYLRRLEEKGLVEVA